MLALTLTAACALGATGKITLAVPGLSYVDLSPGKGDAVLDYFGQKLEASGRLRVITRSEVGQLLGFERQKTLAGCDDVANQCMVELGEALGAEVILIGSLARIGSGFTVSLRAARPGSGVVLFTAGDRIANEDLLLEWLATQAPLLVKALTASLRPGEDAPGVSATSGGGLRARSWVPFVAAGVLAAGASVALVLSQSDAARLQTRTPSFADRAEIDAVAGRGETLQLVGWGALVGAVAAAVTGAGFLVFGGESAPQVSLQVGPGSAGLAVQGALPW